MLHPEHAAHNVGDGERARHESQPLWLRGVVRVGVGGGDDDETDGVVRDGEQQQELDAGVVQREDLHRRHPCERDVGRGGHSPANREICKLEGPRLQRRRAVAAEAAVAAREVGGGFFEPAMWRVRRRGGRVLWGDHVAFEGTPLELQVEEGEVCEDRPQHASDGGDERWERLARR
eukprot:2318476-Prymnesium_polylepis.1